MKRRNNRKGALTRPKTEKVPITERLLVPHDFTPVISVAKYRSLTKDTVSPDQIVLRRLLCIEKLCRGVIISELRNHG